jgi:hypothetical protein
LRLEAGGKYALRDTGYGMRVAGYGLRVAPRLNAAARLPCGNSTPVPSSGATGQAGYRFRVAGGGLSALKLDGCVFDLNYSNSERATPDCRIIESNVPVRISL